MNIQFGKREQIVVIVLSAVIAITLLHLMVFSGRAKGYREALADYEGKKAQTQKILRIADRNRFNKFTSNTKQFQTDFESALTSFGLSRPPAFEIPLVPADLVLDPPPPARATAAEITKLKQERFPIIRKEKIEAQIQLVIDELKKLVAFDQRRPGAAPNVSAEATKLLFLGDGLGGYGKWGMPVRLPTNVYSGPGATVSGTLLDILRDIDQTKDVLARIAANQPELRDEQRTFYQNRLKDLGIDNDFYRDCSGIGAMGEYVPIIHKLAYALLLEDAILGSVKTISDKPVTRELILSWLEINLPTDALPGQKISELYFVYEQLRHLNLLLALAQKQQLAQVFGVRFEPAAYVREQISLPNPEPGAGPPKQPAPPPDCTKYVIQQESSDPQGPPATSPEANDLGYCVPIILEFRANNLNAWNFIYAVLKEFQLAEVDEITMNATPETTGDVNCRIKFLFIPFLFAAEAPPATPTPGPPPPPPPPSAPKPK